MILGWVCWLLLLTLHEPKVMIFHFMFIHITHFTLLCFYRVDTSLCFILSAKLQIWYFLSITDSWDSSKVYLFVNIIRILIKKKKEKEKKNNLLASLRHRNSLCRFNSRLRQGEGTLFQFFWVSSCTDLLCLSCHCVHSTQQRPWLTLKNGHTATTWSSMSPTDVAC